MLWRDEHMLYCGHWGPSSLSSHYCRAKEEKNQKVCNWGTSLSLLWLYKACRQKRKEQCQWSNVRERNSARVHGWLLCFASQPSLPVFRIIRGIFQQSCWEEHFPAVCFTDARRRVVLSSQTSQNCCWQFWKATETTGKNKGGVENWIIIILIIILSTLVYI